MLRLLTELTLVIIGKEIIYKNSAKDFTLGQAVEAYKEGIAIAVNDGKDLTIIIEDVE